MTLQTYQTLLPTQRSLKVISVGIAIDVAPWFLVGHKRELWENCCPNRDETWQGGWSRPQSHRVKRAWSTKGKGVQSPLENRNVYCTQTIVPIVMKFCTEPDLGQGQILLGW